MKKRIILLIVLGLLVCGAAALWRWQGENLRALQAARKYSDDELSAMEEENQRQIDSILTRLPEESKVTMPQEVKDQLERGEISQEEAISAIVQESGSGQQTQEQEPSGDAAQQETETAKKRIAELVAEVYVLQASYTSQLSQMESEAIAGYRALPASERTKAKQVALAMDYFSKISAMESSCDGQMAAIAGEMKQLLAQTGGDTSVAEEMLTAYQQEKAVQKAQYISKYSQYLQ